MGTAHEDGFFTVPAGANKRPAGPWNGRRSCIETVSCAGPLSHVEDDPFEGPPAGWDCSVRAACSKGSPALPLVMSARS